MDKVGESKWGEAAELLQELYRIREMELELPLIAHRSYGFGRCGREENSLTVPGSSSSSRGVGEEGGGREGAFGSRGVCTTLREI